MFDSVFLQDYTHINFIIAKHGIEESTVIGNGGQVDGQIARWFVGIESRQCLGQYHGPEDER